MHIRGRDAGFTLLELMVTIAVAGVLLGVAIPGFITWINNGKIRSVADQLQNSIRLAQTEALRRSHQVVFAMTSSQTAPFTSSTANPGYWAIQTIPFMSGETAETIETGNLAGLNNRVQVIPSVGQICFNSVGRLTVPASSPIGGPACTAAVATYRIQLDGSGADTPLQINVGINGQVHMCNPNKTYVASSAPDGCPLVP